MSADESGLGGRLPLYGRKALDPAQKALYDWLMNVAVPWADAADFEARPERAGSLDHSIRLC
jgi:4-carboxymuconolactone decarboxylase